MLTYSKNHTKKECDKHFHQLDIVATKRTYSYHKQGIIALFKCGDKVKYKKKKKIKGNTKTFVFVVQGLNINEQKLLHNDTKKSKMKFCSILESNSLVFI